MLPISLLLTLLRQLLQRSGGLSFVFHGDGEHLLLALQDLCDTQRHLYINATLDEIPFAVQTHIHIVLLGTGQGQLDPDLLKQFRKIKKSDFQNAIIRLEQAGKSKSTCEKMRQLFSQLSKWALAEEIIQMNHAQHLETVAKQLSTKEVLSDDDIKAIQQSKNRGVSVVLILLACGCRPNELFNAPLENCHEDYFIGGSKTEAGKNRPIVISPLGLDAYKALRAEAINKGGKKLIDGFEGNRDQHNFAKREFRDLMKEIARPEITMYCCRHTYITNAARSGVDQRALQQMVGHVDKETTKIYTHLNVDDLRTESEKIKTNAVCNKSVTRSERSI